MIRTITQTFSLREYCDISSSDRWSPANMMMMQQIEEVEIGEKSPLSWQCSSKSSITGWKLDLNALGVSYKVKRLKQ
ncbi:hypothetical protein RHMOL_Rhmol07G0268500 [Rhododendron molle]|uniref:Uncharacterized protein n=1 Tax=Rhododendron molle TaxID=49168 RepID=A0ACC0N5C0_RHOML|nr:hypothetical protein RHMOL_Rhmol07G0268500 [Rhododendron molle]